MIREENRRMVKENFLVEASLGRLGSKMSPGCLSLARCMCRRKEWKVSCVVKTKKQTWNGADSRSLY